MKLKGLFRIFATALGKFVDSDKDGKLELSDLPGAIAKVAALRAEGAAMVAAADAFADDMIDAAGNGQVTVGGKPTTADELRAAFARAKALPVEAGELARAELAKS